MQYNVQPSKEAGKEPKEIPIAGAGTHWDSLMMSDDASKLLGAASVGLFSLFLI
jgi:hypothetical protein